VDNVKNVTHEDSSYISTSTDNQKNVSTVSTQEVKDEVTKTGKTVTSNDSSTKTEAGYSHESHIDIATSANHSEAIVTETTIEEETTVDISKNGSSVIITI
jgi:uncharacterized protein YuzE